MVWKQRQAVFVGREQQSFFNSNGNLLFGFHHEWHVKCNSIKMENHEEAMQEMYGLLRIRVKKGVELVVRDVRSSDPYVVVKMGNQRLKTRVINKDVNPEWDEDLTLSVTDPTEPVSLTVYDYDTFSKDDEMGDADVDIKPFIDALKMNLEGAPDGTVVSKVHPGRHNSLAEESEIVWEKGHVIQDMCLRLNHVESGEVHIQLQWIHLPGSKPL